MSGNFEKALDSYESNNHPVNGKYHFDIPHDIEPACYSMDIDYESHDELHPEAYQYKGYIVVGHRLYLKTSPIIIPFNTSANTEEAVTLYEKRNTSFNIIAEAFSDVEMETGIRNLPLDVRFAKGLFRDYYLNTNTAPSTIKSDYNNATVSSSITLPVRTNNNGKTTTNIKVSDIYNIEESINDINTIFFKCKGTRDRGTDNYVPAIVEAPLIIGTTSVDFIRHMEDYVALEQEDVPFALPEDSPIPATCGTGEIHLGTTLLYHFALNPEQHYDAKKHYEMYVTDPSLHVKVGGLQLEYNAGDGWVKAEARELAPANNTTTILNDGTIIHTPNTNGVGVDVIWTNPLSSSTSKMITWRWKYIGKPGATFSRYSPNYPMAIDPSLGTPTCVDTELIITNPSNGVINATYGVPFTITGQIVEIGTNNRVNESGQLVSVTIGSDVYNGTVTNGAFTIEIPNTRTGSFSGNVVYTPSSSAFVGSNEVIGVTVSQQELEITDVNVQAERGAKATITAKVVKIGTSNVVGGGTISCTVNGATSTVPVAANGTFTIRTANNVSSSTNGTLSLTPVNSNYSCSDKTFTIALPEPTSINILSGTSNLSISYTETARISGEVVYGNERHNELQNTVSVTINNTTHTVNMQGSTFTLDVPNLPANTYNVQIEYNSPNTNLYENCSTTTQVVVAPCEVNISLPGTTLSIWDSGASDSDSMTVSIEDEFGNQIREGTLKLFLKPTSNIIDPVEVWTTNITSNNSWTLNSYGNLNFTSLFSQLENLNRLNYVNYTLSAKYLPASTNYVEETQSGATVRYRCTQPRLSIIGTTSFIDPSATHRHQLLTTHAVGTETFGTGFIEETWERLGDHNLVQLQITSRSDNNKRIVGIPHFWWFTSSSETFDVYKTNDDGSYVLDGNGNRIYATDEYYKDANGQSTNIPLHPCNPGYPIPMRYGKRTPNLDRTTSSVHTYEWMGGDASGNSDSISLYFVFDRYLQNIFPDIENTITNPYKVVTNENPATSTYSLVVKINLRMSH